VRSSSRGYGEPAVPCGHTQQPAPTAPGLSACGRRTDARRARGHGKSGNRRHRGAAVRRRPAARSGQDTAGKARFLALGCAHLSSSAPPGLAIERGQITRSI